jgi:quinol monooxygenase YgiN
MNNDPDGQGMLKDLEAKLSPDAMPVILPLLAEFTEHMSAVRAVSGNVSYKHMNIDQQKKVRVFLSDFKSRFKDAIKRARVHNSGSSAISTAEALRIIRKHIT